MKFIINLVEIYVLLRIIWKAARFFLGGKRGKVNKSITGKIFTLVSRAIHHRLDKAINKQKEILGIKTNVVPFRRFKRKIN